MKKFFCAALIIAMVFTFASCGKDKTDTASSEVTTPVPAENSPTEAADNFIKALKARDNEALKKYYEGDVGDLTLIEGDDEPALSDMINSMLDKIMDFGYTISNEKIDGTDATVDVSIKTYDLGGILILPQRSGGCKLGSCGFRPPAVSGPPARGSGLPDAVFLESQAEAARLLLVQPWESQDGVESSPDFRGGPSDCTRQWEEMRSD